MSRYLRNESDLKSFHFLAQKYVELKIFRLLLDFTQSYYAESPDKNSLFLLSPFLHCKFVIQGIERIRTLNVPLKDKMCTSEYSIHGRYFF